MIQQQRPPLSTFIIRFWQESGPGAPRWRGDARHIQSGERISFTDEAALTRFVRRWVRMPGDKGERPREGR